jgi:hypothetical protein
MIRVLMTGVAIVLAAALLPRATADAASAKSA